MGASLLSLRKETRMYREKMIEFYQQALIVGVVLQSIVITVLVVIVVAIGT